MSSSCCFNFAISASFAEVSAAVAVTADGNGCDCETLGVGSADVATTSFLEVFFLNMVDRY